MEKFEKKIKLILKCFIIFCIFYFSKYLQYIPVKLFNIDLNNITPKMSAVLSTFSTVILFFIFFIIYRKDLKKEFSDFWKNKSDYINVGIRYWIIGLIIMFIANYILNFVFKAGGATNEKIVQTLIKSFPLIMIIDAGILAPFNEEIVFRKSIKDAINNKWIFYIVTFLLFGGAHVVKSSNTILDYLFIIPYGALGVAFACAYNKTKNIFTSISMHMMHNTILILLSIITTLL